MYRRRDAGLEVFIVHPGGPFFAKRDHRVWTIPKGEIEPGEAAFDVAVREFGEETGRRVEECRSTAGPPDLRDGFIPLGSVVQRAGKTVEAWAFEGAWPDGVAIVSNTFSIEWPPRSGRTREFPEVDRGGFFTAEEAAARLNPAQVPFLERLRERLP